jgi:hypothetical protein
VRQGAEFHEKNSSPVHVTPAYIIYGKFSVTLDLMYAIFPFGKDYLVLEKTIFST